MTIDMSLTPEGLRHTDDIITAIFAYIRLMRAMDEAVRLAVAAAVRRHNADRVCWQEWRRVHKELADVAEMSFRFKS
jgi:secreted Zn-dependent insulinase-like peptidase